MFVAERIKAQSNQYLKRRYKNIYDFQNCGQMLKFLKYRVGERLLKCLDSGPFLPLNPRDHRQI